MHIYIYIYMLMGMHSVCIYHKHYGAFPEYAHKKFLRIKYVNVFLNNKTAQVRNNFSVSVFNVGLLARSQFASKSPASSLFDQSFPWFS
jgi:hypothetical protein